MTGSCVVNAALEKGKHCKSSRNFSLRDIPKGKQVKILVRDESTVPAEFKDKVEIIKGDVLVQADVDRTVEGTDAVIIVLGTRNKTEPTTMMSEGTKNIMQAMKSKGLKKFSACMSSFLFMQPEMVPKVFLELNADHKVISQYTLDKLLPQTLNKLIKMSSTH